MILQALADYYRRKQADPDPAQRLPAYGFEEKEIPFILEIDSEGRLVQILDTRSGIGLGRVFRLGAGQSIDLQVAGATETVEVPLPGTIPTSAPAAAACPP